MRKILLSALIVGLLAMQGCTASSGSSNSSSLPDGTVSASNTYYSEFPSIPIPVDLEEDIEFTNVMYNIDGTKSGTQRFEGPLERKSLVRAMTHNMIRQGWQARVISSVGERNLMVFQNTANQVAIMTLSDTSMSSKTVVDLWVAQFLPDNIIKVQQEYQQNLQSGQGSSFSVAPATPAPTYGEQGLAQ